MSTLKERLDELKTYSKLGKKYDLPAGDSEIEERRASILEDFYRENKRAADVASGRDSFVNYIKRIEGQYDTFWKKIAPKKNTEFDEYATDVIKDLNHVGAMKLDHRLYTSEGTRKYIRKLDKLTMIMGACFATLAAYPAYIHPNSPASLDSPSGIIWGLSPLVFLFAPTISLRPMEVRTSNIVMQRLRDAAKKTDEFLKENSISSVGNF